MNQPAKILLVDDDQELRDLLTDRLRAYEFAPTAVSCGADMFAALMHETYDLILLDIMLPGEDGLALCRRLRATGTACADIPIIFLTALKDTTDRVVGLEIGGDDYLPKPFETRELVARIRALLRRTRGRQAGQSSADPLRSGDGKGAASWRFGLWKLNALARHLIDQDGVVVQLSAAEYRLLMLFLEHPQQVLSRERIMECMSERQAEIYDRSIDVQISRLRSKLRDKGRNSELIRTMRGDGYMLTVHVQAGDA